MKDNLDIDNKKYNGAIELYMVPMENLPHTFFHATILTWLILQIQ